MNDEDDEFLDLFDGDICYIDGGNQSGFYLVEEPVFETRLAHIISLYCVKADLGYFASKMLPLLGYSQSH